MKNRPRKKLWLAATVIVVVGLIHALEAGDGFEEAAYKGWLFYANGIGSLLAAYGILHGMKWGWLLGGLIAAGSITAYIASRTVGLPLIPAEPDAWLEPLGVASLVSEAVFLVLLKLTFPGGCGEK